MELSGTDGGSLTGIRRMAYEKAYSGITGVDRYGGCGMRIIYRPDSGH